LFKAPGNPLTTLALLGKFQTPGKIISGVKTPRNAKYNPAKTIIFVVLVYNSNALILFLFLKNKYKIINFIS